MLRLYDQCDKHDYIYIKTASEVMQHEYRRIVNKEIYACVHCGVAMEIYDLDNPIKLDKEDDQAL